MPSGRRVRCSACQYIWFQEPDEDEIYEGYSQEETDDENDDEHWEPIPESVIPGPQSLNEKILEEMSVVPVVTSLAASALLFLLFAAGAVLARNSLVEVWPPSVLLFETAGFETRLPGEGLIFDRVKAFTGYDEHGNEILSVNGKIINLRDRPVFLPPVEARILEEGQRTGQSWKVDIEKKRVNAEKSVKFSTSYPEIGEGIRQVQVGFTMRKSDWQIR
jgi:hypothetical protein